MSQSVVFYIAYPLQVAGKLEPIAADLRCNAGYTLDRAPVHCRATIYTAGKFRVAKLT